METTSSILLIAILSATVTYHVGLMNPPGCLLHNDGNEQHDDGDPILLTTRCKAFFYCNSVAFVASLIAIILAQRVRQEHQALKAAITLQVFGLVGAYAAATCRDVMSISFSCAIIVILAGVILVHDVGYALFMYIFGQREKIKQELMETNCVVIFGMMFTNATYYQATPSEAAFYFNLSSFLLLSVVLIIHVVTPNLYKRAIKSEPIFVSGAAVMMRLFVITFRRMTEYMQTTGYITILIWWTILFRSRVDNADNDGEDTADVVNDTTSCHTPPDTEDGIGNRWDAKDIYVVFLGVLTARVTYLAVLESPFGKVRDGSGMDGNMHGSSRSRPWYLIFFYSNAFSFVASIIVVVLLLLQLLHKRRLSKVVNRVIVLDLLGLLVAHVTSSCRSLNTIGCLSSLTVTVLAYFVICMMLSFFDRRKTPAAAASASQSS